MVILVGAAVLSLAACVVAVSCYLRMVRLAEPHRRFLHALGQMEFPEDLTAYLELLGTVHRRVEDLRARVDAIQQAQQRSFATMGLVKFDAFDHMGGMMSFSLALLDRRGNGCILTGLHGRDSFDAYCRTVRNGRVEHELMPEEIEALNEALGGLSAS